MSPNGNILATILALAPCQAFAHPHVFVTVKSEVVVNSDGNVTAIDHHWTFDDMYSSFVTVGLGKDGQPPSAEELLPIAKTNVDELEQFRYFTLAKAGSRSATYAKPVDYRMSFNTADQTVTLHFKLPMAPALPARPFFNFSVYDPSYFIAFSFEKEAPVALQAASAGCSLSVVKPSELSAADQRKLNEAYLSNMSPGEDFGSKLADRAIIACS